MSRARGRMPATMANARWPHQIVLAAEKVNGRCHPPIMAFCKGLDKDPLGHSYVHDGGWHVVFAFAQREDAERFQATFGGEWTDHEQRRALKSKTARR